MSGWAPVAAPCPHPVIAASCCPSESGSVSPSGHRCFFLRGAGAVSVRGLAGGCGDPGSPKCLGDPFLWHREVPCRVQRSSVSSRLCAPSSVLGVRLRNWLATGTQLANCLEGGGSGRGSLWCLQRWRPWNGGLSRFFLQPDCALAELPFDPIDGQPLLLFRFVDFILHSQEGNFGSDGDEKMARVAVGWGTPDPLKPPGDLQFFPCSRHIFLGSV